MANKMAYFVLWNHVLDRVIESEVDHVKDSIATNCGGHSLVDTPETILCDDLLGHLPSSGRFLGPSQGGKSSW